LKKCRITQCRIIISPDDCFDDEPLEIEWTGEWAGNCASLYFKMCAVNSHFS